MRNFSQFLLLIIFLFFVVFNCFGKLLAQSTPPFPEVESTVIDYNDTPPFESSEEILPEENNIPPVEEAVSIDINLPPSESSGILVDDSSTPLTNLSDEQNSNVTITATQVNYKKPLEEEVNLPVEKNSGIISDDLKRVIDQLPNEIKVVLKPWADQVGSGEIVLQEVNGGVMVKATFLELPSLDSPRLVVLNSGCGGGFNQENLFNLEGVNPPLGDLGEVNIDSYGQATVVFFIPQANLKNEDAKSIEGKSIGLVDMSESLSDGVLVVCGDILSSL